MQNSNKFLFFPKKTCFLNKSCIFAFLFNFMIKIRNIKVLFLIFALLFVFNSKTKAQTIIWSNDFETPVRDSEWNNVFTSSSDNYWQINQGCGGCNVCSPGTCLDFFGTIMCLMPVNEEFLASRVLHIGADFPADLCYVAANNIWSFFVSGTLDLSTNTNMDISTIGYNNVFIEFNSRSGGGTLSFYYSTNGGGTWSSPINISTSAWTTKTITTAILGNDLDEKSQIRLKYRWVTNTSILSLFTPWAIDDIVIKGTPTVATNDDIGVTAIQSVPAPPTCEGLHDLQVTVENFGTTTTITDYDLEYYINTNLITTFSITGTSIAPGATEVVTFTDIDFTAGATNIKFITKNPNGNSDADNTNDAFDIDITFNPIPISIGVYHE